jgi:hypothetical protein
MKEEITEVSRGRVCMKYPILHIEEHFSPLFMEEEKKNPPLFHWLVRCLFDIVLHPNGFLFETN